VHILGQCKQLLRHMYNLQRP